MASLYDQIVNGEVNNNQPNFYKQITGEDYYVAPVKTTTKKKKKKNSWFDAGAFSDGYDVGDITKTILGTVGDVTTGFANGALNITEGIGDLIGYGIANVVEATGNKSFANDLRKEYQKNLYDEAFAPSREIIDNSGWSISGNKTDNISKIAGGIGLNVATGGAASGTGMGVKGITALTTGMSGTSTAGRSMGEAYRNGATNEQAAMYGAISGVSSALVNMLVGGYGNSVQATGLSSGIGKLDDRIATALTQKISNQLVKNFTEMGIKSVGEGFENVATGIIDAWAKQQTYMKNKKDENGNPITFERLLKDEDLLGQFVQGAVTSAVMQTPGVVKTAINKEKIPVGYDKNNNVKYKNKYSLKDKEAVRDYISGLTQNEQKVYDKEVEKRIAARENEGVKLNSKQRNQIKNQTKADLMNGYISTDTIEEALGEGRYTQYQRLNERKADIEDEINALNKKIRNDLDRSADEGIDNFDELGKFAKEQANDKKRIKELKGQLESVNRSIEKSKEYLGTEVENRTQKDDYLRESYNERSRRREKFSADLNGYSDKQKTIVQKAIDSGILNNSKKTHDFVNMLAKVSEDKGIDFDFTNNDLIKDNDVLLDKNTFINGFTKDGKVSLNIDSQKSLNALTGHEIGHVFEDSINADEYTRLKNSIKEYAKTKGDYDKVYSKMENLYKNVKGADVESETINELIGDYLFTDKDFINKLSASDKNAFNKMYDEVKYLSKVATAGSKEKRQLEKVKKTFQDIYNENELNIENTNKVDVTEEQTETVEKVQEVKPIKEEQQEEIKQQNKENTEDEKIFPLKRNRKKPQEDEKVFPLKRKKRTEKTTGVVNEEAEDIIPIKKVTEKSKKASKKIEDIAPVQEQTNGEVDPYEDFGNNIEKYLTPEEAKKLGIKDTKYSLAKNGKKDYNSDNIFSDKTIDDYIKENPEKQKYKSYSTSKKFFELDTKTMDELSAAASSKALKIANEKKADGHFNYTSETNGKSYTVYEDVMDEGNVYNITHVEEIKPDVEAEVNERIKKSDNGLLVKDSEYGQRNIDRDTKSSRYRETSESVSELFETESEQPRGNGSKQVDKNSTKNIRKELDNSSFFNEKAPVRKTNNLNEYIEDVSTREAQQLARDKSSAKQIINDYLDENNIKNPTMKDINNAFDDYEEFDSTGWGTDESKRARKIFDDVAKEVYNERNKGLEGSSFSLSENTYNLKQKQLDIINKSNPAPDDNHTWIRSTDDIKTFNEAFFEDGEYSGMDPDFTEDMAQKSIDSGKITVYSSYPIEDGTFVSPSKMEASQYAGGDESKLYSKTVNIDDVAWIDGAEGQYARASDAKYSISKKVPTQDNKGRLLSKEQQRYFKDSKVTNEKGELLKVYHGTMNDFTVFDKKKIGSNFAESEHTGFFFTNVEKTAKTYGKNIKKFYLNIKNPLEITSPSAIHPIQYFDGHDIMSEVWAHGNDGIIIKGTGEYVGKNLYIALEPEQIKNVDNLNPTDNPDIRYSKGNDDIAPIGNYNVYGDDIRIEQDKAPTKNELGYIPKDPTREDSYDFDDSYKKETDPVEEILRTELRRKDEERQAKIEAKKNKQTTIEKSGLRKATDRFKRMFVNSNVEIDNLAKESGNDKIKYAGDMLNNVYAETQNDINNAQTDNNGVAIGKSIKQLFKDAKSQGLDEAFNDYLIHYSNIDRHKFEKGSVVPLDVSEQVVKDYENIYPQFKEWGKDVWNYGKNVKNNLLDAGVITQETSDRLTELYPHYVPYMEDRDLSQYIDDVGEVKPVSTIKRGKGGAENLLPVEEALTRYTYSQKKAVRQNQLYSEIVNTLYDDKNPINFTLDDSDYKNVQGNLYRDEKGNYLTAFVDGKEKSARISDDLYNTLNRDMENQVKNMEQDLEIITKPLQKASKIRRNILTSWNPTFIVKNAVKDVQDASFNSKYSKDFLKNYPTAFKELTDNKNQLASQFKALYGSGNLMGEYDADSGLYTGVNSKNSGFLKGISKANNIVELAPRYAEFKSSIENGASVQEAMYNAREVTTNFSRGGVITKAMNRNGFTFLNANVQGLDKFIRNFSGENGAKGVANSLVKATVFGVAPAVFNELAFNNGGKKDEDYEALPDYIKDNYYVIKTGDGSFYRIPKGRALSVFGSAARRTLEYANGDENAFDGYLQNVNSQIGVSNPEENNLFAPIMQAYGSENGKAWYGGDLLPTRLQSKPKAEQYDETTDEFSKWLGEKLNASPYKINYLIDQYSGGIGDIVLPTITKEASSNNDSVLGTALAPIKDQFVVNSTTDNKYVSEFYDTNDKLNVKANSYNATDDDLLKKQYMSSMSSELSKLYAERREVQNDETMSRSERYKKSQNIKNEINRISKEALDSYNKLERLENYATIGEKEYYKGTDGKWKGVKEKEADYLNSLGLTSNEKNSYFSTTNSISEIKSNYKDLIAGATDEQKTYLNHQRKSNIINSIKNSGLTNEAKAYLYDKNYGDTDTLRALSDLDVNMDQYMNLESQYFTNDKYTNGKTVPNSKKRKVFNYINSMNVPFEQKIILAKLKYNSYDDYNYEIIQYLNKSNLDYDTEMLLLKKMGFKVTADGKVSWK